MDFPIKVPGVGLVAGRFVDEDPALGRQGSLIPSDWGNSVTDELLNVIRAAGFKPSEEDHSQLLEAIRKLAGDEKNVQMTSSSGAALLPEGNSAQRPGVGEIPAGYFLFRGNTQDQADYKPEFFDRVAAVWRVLASRDWASKITDSLALRILELENNRQLPIGQGQKWQDVTASRLANVNYTNTTGRAIAVSAILGSAPVQATQIMVGGVIAGHWICSGSNVSQGCFAIVPAGHLYRVINSQGGSSVQHWSELRE